MNDSKYRWMLYLITSVIVGTIAIQVYWNFNNYQINKQQLINDVQTSLDNAVDTYYANLAEKNTVGFMLNERAQDSIFGEDGTFEDIMGHLDFTANGISGIDSLMLNKSDGIAVFTGNAADSLLVTINDDHRINEMTTDVRFKRREAHPHDSIVKRNFNVLTSKVIISMTQDSLDLKNVDSLLKSELARKKLDLSYNLSYQDPLEHTQRFGEWNSSKKIRDTLVHTAFLSTISKSEFLPKNSMLKMNFDNATKQVLLRSSMGILLSTLLVLAVISSLFYLLKIIKEQKQLAEVKNDLISNITHEFKTPIATIGVALESIKNFNVLNDKQKTENYLDMSNDQLSKLNLMVEKLLETATLDSDNLELNREEVDLVAFLEAIVKKHQLQLKNKSVSFEHTQDQIIGRVDVFHFENAINNLLDNAIKYGGDDISVGIDQNNQGITIKVSDNGTGLAKAKTERIFEKFYRVPKGNTHDVKGFGIGLYYTKKIIEKHAGTIELALNNKLTTFKISMPND